MQITEFQMALAGAGAALVVGVWGYNAWQERKARRAAEAVFRGNHSDALMGDEEEGGHSSGDERLEPQIDRVEPVFEEDEADMDELPPTPVVTEASPAEPLPTLPDPDEALADPVAEVAVALRFGGPVPAQRIREALAGLPGRASQRTRWISFADGQWREPAAGDNASHQDVYALLQLADRQGAIGEAELVPFLRAVERLAESSGGQSSATPLGDVLAHAHALDDFCAGVDVQIAVHVVSKSADGIAGTKLRGLLESSGFSLRPDGLFHLVDDAGNTLISLSNAGATPFIAEELKHLLTRDVTFWLDVPRVADGPEVFDRLLAAARQLASALDGVLVDDQRQPLSDAVLADIRSKIGEIQARMAANQLPSGGRRALRLFR
ncbi:MAG TPA: cell division protein ZipA C-terminal FtsZ-binding domain-containing protein [Rhodocyclaceae bacterium]